MRINQPNTFADLDALKQLEPALGGLVDLQRALLESASETASPAPLEIPAFDQLRLWQRQGIPLLSALPVHYDWDAISNQFQQICQICTNYLPERVGEIAALERQVEAQPEALRDEVTAALRVPSSDQHDEPEEEQELRSFIFLNTLRPFFQAFAVQLDQDLNDEIWQRGYCPICGGLPDLAYLEDSTRSRRLVCSRCDTTWRFPRVKCPFCGGAESADLGYYPGPEQKYRLYFCNRCHRYLKTLDTTYVGANLVFPVERILTLSMDLAAQAAGYA